MNNLVIIELFKLSRRWLPYILLGLIIFYLVYLAQMSYFNYSNSINSIGPGGYIDFYYDDLVLPKSLNRYFDAVLGLGPYMAIILGGLSVGNEYGWGTIRQLLVKGVGRTRFLWCKIAALGLAMLIGMVIITTVAFVISLITTRAVTGYIDWSFLSISFVGQIFAVTSGIFYCLLIYLLLVIFLSVLLRSAPIAVALGFGFFYIEAIITFQGVNATGWLQNIFEYSISYNIKQLSSVINASAVHESAYPWLQPFSILAAYGMAFFVGGCGVLNKQDLMH